MTQENAEQNTNNQLKSSNKREKTEELKSKPNRGQFCRDLERPSVYQEKSMPWLCSSGLKGEMESLIIEAQDQLLTMRYHQRNIMKQPADSKCKICCTNTKHIVTGYTLAPPKYADTIRWLVTSNGHYINIRDCRLMTSTVNIYLKRS